MHDSQLRDAAPGEVNDKMNSIAKDAQLVLKATPPRIPKSLLMRVRLAHKAPEFADKSVVFIQAPSGHGKTSLLAQWRREALQSGAIAAWLTLDERDDGARFARGLGVAMRMASGRASFGQSYADTVVPGEDNLESLTDWLAEVADLSVEVVLFLDDAHLLSPATVDASLVYLLRNAPANLRVVLAARKPIALPIAEMLAHGQFATVDADTLRFRLDETIAVMNARFGARVGADACVRLHALTEGWPLGLQLALATIEKSPGLNEAIAAFSVRTGDIQRFFVECLVERLPCALADFLTRISFVDSLHPELCDAITGRSDSAEQLQSLQDATPIFHAGVDSEWLRIHPLAREFLRARFEALAPDERRAAHAAAARWLTGRQMYEAAARQALQAGQEQLAYELAARCLYDVLISGQVARVSDWAERLPQDQLERHPRLRVVVGWVLATSERHAEAAALVRPIIDDPAADPGDRCEGAEICAIAAFFADDAESMERILSPWLESLSTRPPTLRTVGVSLRAMLKLYRGLPDQARYLLQQLPTELAATSGGYARGVSDWGIGITYLWQGQVIPAGDVLRAALTRAEDECGRRSPIAVMLASALAAVHWERDSIDEVASLLADRLDVLERRAPPDAIITGYVSAARAATVAGLERRAFDLLEHLHTLGEARALPRLQVASLAEQIRMHALRAHNAVCSTLVGRLARLTGEQPAAQWGILGPSIALQAGLARAYGAIARQDWRQVLDELAAIDPIAERLRRTRDRIQIGLLRALTMKRCGDDAAALFGEALSLAETLGLERIVVDTHPDLVDWARRLRGIDGGMCAPQPSSPPAAKRTRSAAQGRVTPSALLTTKESEVLQCLAGNLSNKEIALALDVSGETIKWHLKNLFGKLKATNRKHLLGRARMLGILDAVD